MNLSNQKKMLALLCASAMLVGCNDDDNNSSSGTEPTPKAVELNILHINDHHSHLDEESLDFKMNLGAGEEKFSVARGGFSRVASFINQRAAESSNVLKMHAGDAITGDLFFNLTDGKADADAMNTVCFDSFTLGNHEFDSKDAGLKKFIDFLDAGKCAEPTKILSANVTFGASSPLYQTKRVEKSHIFERGGEKFAVIGLTVAKKTKNSSQPNADTLFSDEIETAQKEIDRLKASGVNKIILQTHAGYDLEKKLAQSLTDVDVVIGGDSHTLLGPESLIKYELTPEGPYPTQLKNKDGDLVCVAQAWQYSYIVGELNVQFDPAGKVTSCKGTPHLLIDDQFKRGTVEVSAIEKTNILKQFKVDQVPFTVVKRLTLTDQVLAPYKAQKKAFAEKIVGQATDNLCSRRVPGTQRDTGRSSLGDVCNQNEHVNQHGGDIQQIVAEAFLQQGKAYFDADLSFQNGGGVRVDIAKGDVTVNNIYTVLPFKNTLVRLDMTGAEVKATLEDAMNGVLAEGNSGSYPYTGGLTWNVDFNKAYGQRISQLKVRNASGGYDALDPAKTYKVITIDFLANGSDYYTAMKNVTGERREDVGLDYAEAFLTYVQSLQGTEGQKQINKLNTLDYSTQLFTDAPK